MSLAPPDLDVTLVDLNLSQSEQITLCKNADAIISSYVTVDVLKDCPKVKLIQTLSAGFDQLDAGTIGEMGIPIANIKVIPMEIGGGVGGKTLIYLEPVAALLAKKSGKPVKVAMSRADVFEASGPTSG